MTCDVETVGYSPVYVLLGLLQVTVGEVPGGVVNWYNALLDLGRKGGTPESGRMSRSKEDAPPHAQLDSIYWTNHWQVVWHHLHQVHWLKGDITHQGFKVSQVILEEVGDLDLVLWIISPMLSLHGACTFYWQFLEILHNFRLLFLLWSTVFVIYH